MAGNILTRKVGPLPTWGWLAIVTGGGIAYYLYSGSGSSSALSSGTSTTSAPNAVYPINITNQIPTQAPPPVPNPKPKGPVPGPKPPIGFPPYRPPHPPRHRPPHHKKGRGSGSLIASGHYDLQKTATGHGLTEEQLEKLNPQLRSLEGTGRPIPRGTKIRLR